MNNDIYILIFFGGLLLLYIIYNYNKNKHDYENKDYAESLFHLMKTTKLSEANLTSNKSHSMLDVIFTNTQSS